MEKTVSRKYLALVAAFLVTNCYGGEKSQLQWKPFNAGIAEAKMSGKKVMIDVYTDWCGWCKKMDKDTYSDAAVADYLSKEYVAIKLNAESSNALEYQGKKYTEQELSAAFGITGYPSIIFLTDNGEPITVLPGYADAKQFKGVLSYIADDHYKTTKFQDYLKSQ